MGSDEMHSLLCSFNLPHTQRELKMDGEEAAAAAAEEQQQ